MQRRGTWSALTSGYKCIVFWYFKHKTLNTDILKYFKNEKFTLNVKLKSSVGGSKSLLTSELLRLNESFILNGWFIQ